MRYWLLKSEPEAYAWDDLVSAKRGRWDGVRSHAAAANLRAMRRGDLAIFYHSGSSRPGTAGSKATTGKAAVGIMRVVRIAYADPTVSAADRRRGDWVAVDVAPVRALKWSVSLAEMQSDPVLKGMRMVRQGRLSVAPVTAAEWKRLLKLGSGR